MVIPTRSNLLIMGIVAQHMASNHNCTAYTVSHDYGISHVTARKELTTLEACGLLEKEDTLTRRGFHRTLYKVSIEGFHYLRENLKLYTDAYLDMLFTGYQWR